MIVRKDIKEQKRKYLKNGFTNMNKYEKIHKKYKIQNNVRQVENNKLIKSLIIRAHEKKRNMIPDFFFI